jgi:outer membrane protein assembly factor BamB
MAADPSGDTYFAHDGFLFNSTVAGGSSIIALDPCGIVRWRAPWNHAQKQDEQAFLMVSGEQLIAEHGDVEAFELASGAHLWTADLSGLAGAGDLSDAYLGAPVAASDGTSYLTATNDQGATWLLAIDASGVAKVLASVPNIAPNGSPMGLILDSAGRLDLSLAESNVFLAPGAIDVFGRDGSLEIITPLANVGPQNLLMAGTGFVLNESTGDLVGPDGGVLGRLPLAPDEPAVIDAQGNVFAVGQSTAVTVSRLDLAGAVRWGAPFPGVVWEYYGGPVLGDGAELFFLAQTLDADNQEGATVAAIDVEDGTTETWSFPGVTPAYLLLTAAGEVVFASGGQVVSLASGGERPAADAPWPTPRGGVDQRGAALGE